MKVDLETMFSGSDGQVHLLPGLLTASRLPDELPHLGLQAQQAVNHPDGQLSCSMRAKKQVINASSFKNPRSQTMR